jgi:hypothetical protein
LEQVITIRPLSDNDRKEDYPDLAIDQHLALFIPLPTYFFVTPKKPELARRIEEGLIVMIYDGSFDRFFQERYADVIADANLENRKIFKLSNPNLGPNTPFDVKHFWYRPKN